jgi:hypothetical protein
VTAHRRRSPGPFGSFESRDRDTLPIHGRLHPGDGWERVAEEAVALGCATLSLGFDRLAEPGVGHARHLAAVVTAKPKLDAIVGPS